LCQLSSAVPLPEGLLRSCAVPLFVPLCDIPSGEHVNRGPWTIWSVGQARGTRGGTAPLRLPGPHPSRGLCTPSPGHLLSRLPWRGGATLGIDPTALSPQELGVCQGSSHTEWPLEFGGWLTCGWDAPGPRPHEAGWHQKLSCSSGQSPYSRVAAALHTSPTSLSGLQVSWGQVPGLLTLQAVWCGGPFSPLNH
jgi:hypothetical protein